MRSMGNMKTTKLTMKNIARPATYLFAALTVLFLATAGFMLISRYVGAQVAVPDGTSAVAGSAVARRYTASELARYDGSDSALPILLAMNGEVYDVTAGKEYYVPGGTYHFLAGHDSSAELNLIGGDIIRRKYPVVGVLDP